MHTQSCDRECAQVTTDPYMGKILVLQRFLYVLAEEEKKMVCVRSSLALSIQIVAAIGLSKGHWFKCPKGHLYAIGECGGAMETSKCPGVYTLITC